MIPEGQGLCLPRSNRLPTGPGSRGGHWHDREWRNAYQRAWRAAHPEYREREKLRRARLRLRERGFDPADIVSSSPFPRPFPEATVACACECGCGHEVPTVCGFCRQGLHKEET